MTITLEALLQTANSLTVVAVLALIIYSGTKGIWVFRRELDRRDADIAEVRQREQWWKELYMRNVNIGEKAVEVAKTAINEVHKT